MSSMMRLMVVAVLGVLLTACGGGSSPPGTNVVGYPDCRLGVGGTDDLAGCWVSERCATNLEPGTPFRSARGLEYITQDDTIPNISGSIYPYVLGYDTPDCSGKPTSILDITALAKSEKTDISMTYEVLGYALCGDANDPYAEDTSCVRMDVASFYQYDGREPLTSNGDVYYLADVQARLCLNVGNYNFDDEAQGGINPGWTTIDDPELDVSSGACLVRFTP